MCLLKVVEEYQGGRLVEISLEEKWLQCCSVTKLGGLNWMCNRQVRRGAMPNLANRSTGNVMPAVLEIESSGSPAHDGTLL